MRRLYLTTILASILSTGCTREVILEELWFDELKHGCTGGGPYGGGPTLTRADSLGELDTLLDSHFDPNWYQTELYAYLASEEMDWAANALLVGEVFLSNKADSDLQLIRFVRVESGLRADYAYTADSEGDYQVDITEHAYSFALIDASIDEPIELGWTEAP
ncbi:MAG: hypothetical protein JXX28_14950 [Deltaproteobacteria bacterium]|nr:hypothetical protein [Deltaproteobacteria bacterium]